MPQLPNADAAAPQRRRRSSPTPTPQPLRGQPLSRTWRQRHAREPGRDAGDAQGGRPPDAFVGQLHRWQQGHRALPKVETIWVCVCRRLADTESWGGVLHAEAGDGGSGRTGVGALLAEAVLTSTERSMARALDDALVEARAMPTGDRGCGRCTGGGDAAVRQFTTQCVKRQSPWTPFSAS